MIHARHIGGAALLFMAVSAACTCPGPPCTLTGGGFDGGVMLESSDVTVTSLHQLQFGCEEQIKVDNVGSEVLDDTNDVVPSTASAEEVAVTGGQHVVQVAVAFRTGAPGWYHVRANIEPALGVVQSEVVVARNRLGMPSVFTIRPCRDAYVTSLGAAMCNGALVGDGGTSGLADTTTDVRGDVIWNWTGAGLARSRHTDAGVIPEPSAPLLLPEFPRTLTGSPAGDELYAATSQDVFRIGYRNGALVKLSEIPLGSVFTPGTGFVSEGTLFLVAKPSLSATMTSKVRVCGYSLANGLVTKLPACEEQIGLPMGVIDNALWFRDEGGLRALRGSPDGKLITTAVLRMPELALKSQAPTGAPIIEVLSGGWLVPRLLSGRPIYDLYPSPGGALSAGATETAVFFVTGAGTRIFAR